eukprot:TRINITY_DN15343_c0_g1_i2.p1 TRINITY_DN15343_c0_g1~~TRINITY_DN15343_c0_g1_i2.p1  ORF type:complete len:162 (-),score=20.62 TRINITY_DN15343_c0_g1_i2:248-733(-)
MLYNSHIFYFVNCYLFFFFQAEDGIRDAQESRGLGDVYKRQCETFAIGSEMSGGVFNVTVQGCVFGGDRSDFVGVHLKSMRGRGGAIHSIRFADCVFHSEYSTKQPSPFSASLFYSGTPPPTNATATHTCMMFRWRIRHFTCQQQSPRHPRSRSQGFQSIC